MNNQLVRHSNNICCLSRSIGLNELYTLRWGYRRHSFTNRPVAAARPTPNEETPIKTLSITYAFDKAAGVYVTSHSDVLGINLWDKDLDSLLNRVTRCAPTFIRLNHPELHGSDAIDLSFDDRDGSYKVVIRQISLRPQDANPGVNGAYGSVGFSCG